MKAYVPEYNLVIGKDLDDVFSYLQTGFQPFAGGTDLMVLFESGRLSQKNFVSIYEIPELKQISVDENQIKIGACVTYDEIQNHPIIKNEFSLLTKSAWFTGAKAIQSRGTIGGNIANMSPAADTPPSLLAYGAELNLLSRQGRRAIDYTQFHTGYKKSVLKTDELIENIVLQRKQSWTREYYRKVGTRSFQSISKTAVSGVIKISNNVIENVRLGLASVHHSPCRPIHTEKYLIGQASASITEQDLLAALAKDIAPMNDIRSTANYRMKVTANLILEFVNG